MLRFRSDTDSASADTIATLGAFARFRRHIWRPRAVSAPSNPNMIPAYAALRDARLRQQAKIGG
ncbi:hypothetical protein BA059_00040 [Mycolicibacterium sp. (ex Dasyatis americana)]|nr:hypothetical protein BA059_00040 [Mycolicibacterium sp. (ex Dasyatis americana)]